MDDTGVVRQAHADGYLTDIGRCLASNRPFVVKCVRFVDVGRTRVRVTYKAGNVILIISSNVKLGL